MKSRNLFVQTTLDNSPTNKQEQTELDFGQNKVDWSIPEGCSPSVQSEINKENTNGQGSLNLQNPDAQRYRKPVLQKGKKPVHQKAKKPVILKRKKPVPQKGKQPVTLKGKKPGPRMGRNPRSKKSGKLGTQKPRTRKAKHNIF